MTKRPMLDLLARQQHVEDRLKGRRRTEGQMHCLLEQLRIDVLIEAAEEALMAAERAAAVRARGTEDVSSDGLAALRLGRDTDICRGQLERLQREIRPRRLDAAAQIAKLIMGADNLTSSVADAPDSTPLAGPPPIDIAPVLQPEGGVRSKKRSPYG